MELHGFTFLLHITPYNNIWGLYCVRVTDMNCLSKLYHAVV